jgi:hypothetical protein
MRDWRQVATLPRIKKNPDWLAAVQAIYALRDG